MTRPIRLLLIAGLTLPAPFAQKREIIELTRDVSQVEQDLRALQSSQDQKFGAMQAQIQQTLDAVTKLNSELAVLGNQVDTSLKQVNAPVASLGGRLDSFQQSFNDLKDTVADLSARIGKLDAKMTDLQNAVQLSGGQRAAPPPSNMNPSGGMAATTPTGPGGPPPGMSAETTYSNAYRDFQSGNLDLASQEFSAYLQYFPKTQFAPNAQYYVGVIYFRKGDYDNAVKAFDAVNEEFGDNNKTGDAHYMKGMALMKLGRRDSAVKEFRDVIAHSPDPDLVAKSKAQLRDLGLSTGTARRRR